MIGGGDEVRAPALPPADAFWVRTARYLAYLVLPIVIVHPDYQPILLSLGPAQIRPIDPVLLAAVLIFVGRGGLVHLCSRPRRVKAALLAQGLFLVALGVSGVVAVSNDPSRLGATAVSLVKFFEFGCITLVVLGGLQTPREVERAFLLLAAVAVVAVLFALATQANTVMTAPPSVEHRFPSFVGHNQLGMVTGLTACLGLLRIKRRVRDLLGWLLLGVGLGGLLMSGSIASMLATALVGWLIVAYGWRGFSRRGLCSVLLLLAALAAVALVAVLLRRQQGAFDIKRIGSLYLHLILAASGLLVFLKSPLWGVGWQSSATAAVSDPGMAARLRLWFRDAKPHYFDGRSPSGIREGIHNAYVQWLAEGGLIGMAVLGWLVYQVVRLSAELLHATASVEPENLGISLYCVGGLLFVAVWLNTTGLFAGQLDTGLLWFFIGSALALYRYYDSQAHKPGTAGT